MRKPSKSSFCLISSILLLSLSGCAAFRAGKLPPVSSWPPQSAVAKKSIGIVVSGQVFINGAQQEVAPMLIKNWEQEVLRAYRDSGLFSEVNSGPTPSDLRAEVRIVDRGEGSMAMAALTGFTFYLIPSTATDEFIITTTIRDRNGQIIGKIEHSEAVTLWQQFFLIFIMPAYSPFSVPQEVLYDLNRTTINTAKAKKYL